MILDLCGTFLRRMDAGTIPRAYFTVVQGVSTLLELVADGADRECSGLRDTIVLFVGVKNTETQKRVVFLATYRGGIRYKENSVLSAS
jgi:hypothetical protein